jgi:hypothetical protein
MVPYNPAIGIWHEQPLMEARIIINLPPVRHRPQMLLKCYQEMRSMIVFSPGDPSQTKQAKAIAELARLPFQPARCIIGRRGGFSDGISYGLLSSLCSLKFPSVRAGGLPEFLAARF